MAHSEAEHGIGRRMDCQRAVSSKPGEGRGEREQLRGSQGNRGRGRPRLKR